jgi:hypothetical protein
VKTEDILEDIQYGIHLSRVVKTTDDIREDIPEGIQYRIVPRAVKIENIPENIQSGIYSGLKNHPEAMAAANGTTRRIA